MVSIKHTHDGSLRSLFDLEKGHVSREIYTNEELYQQELEQIFGRCWLFIGHESQVPNPGDYFVSSMGEESVIPTEFLSAVGGADGRAYVERCPPEAARLGVLADASSDREPFLLVRCNRG